jgi:hypothetical protein
LPAYGVTECYCGAVREDSKIWYRTLLYGPRLHLHGWPWVDGFRTCNKLSTRDRQYPTVPVIAAGQTALWRTFDPKVPKHNASMK